MAQYQCWQWVRGGQAPVITQDGCFISLARRGGIHTPVQLHSLVRSSATDESTKWGSGVYDGNAKPVAIAMPGDLLFASMFATLIPKAAYVSSKLVVFNSESFEIVARKSPEGSDGGASPVSDGVRS